jgi:hypothetical protein
MIDMVCLEFWDAISKRYNDDGDCP